MDTGFRDFVLDQLGGLEDISCRKMFDAHGLYYRGMFFGIVHKGSLYLKTNEKTRGAYLDYGSEPFRPSETQTLKNYYEVPGDILEDRERLAEWAVCAASMT